MGLLSNTPQHRYMRDARALRRDDGCCSHLSCLQGQGWQQPDPSLQSLPKAVVDKLQSYPPEFQKIYMQRLDAMVKSKQQQQKSQQEQQRAPQLPPVGVGGVGMAAQGFQSPSMGKASILQVPGMGGEQEVRAVNKLQWL